MRSVLTQNSEERSQEQLTERSLLEAKVPSLKRRISCVYADLRELFSEMELLKTA